MTPVSTTPTGMTPTLIAQDVHKSFTEGRETVDVLKGVSLSLAPGEIVALEGPSGSGKTTLLSILGCILTPTGGRITVAGEEVTTYDQRRLAAVRRRSIGFVFQQYNLFQALTALENVEYALNIKGWTTDARSLAREALEAVGLGDRMDFLPRDMSGGQKQRIAIARAVASRPPLLLADEPTANLDSTTGMQVLELFRTVAQRQHQSLLIVTHDHAVRHIVDRVISIRDGELVQ